jgi:hypothetical protein
LGGAAGATLGKAVATDNSPSAGVKVAVPVTAVAVMDGGCDVKIKSKNNPGKGHAKGHNKVRC